MRFHSPQLMIDAAGDFGEKVGGVDVAKARRLPNGVARRMAKRRQRAPATAHRC